MEVDVLKQFKYMQEQLNRMAKQQEDFLLELHKANSDAIDKIIIDLLATSTNNVSEEETEAVNSETVTEKEGE